MSTKNNFTVSAIICEFNPLHSGHKRLIDYAKSISDAVVCIMSGNFTQRGMPACCDKHSRARHAILAGADLVLELPTVFATSSAEKKPSFRCRPSTTPIRLSESWKPRCWQRQKNALSRWKKSTNPADTVLTGYGLLNVQPRL